MHSMFCRKALGIGLLFVPFSMRYYLNKALNSWMYVVKNDWRTPWWKCNYSHSLTFCLEINLVYVMVDDAMKGWLHHACMSVRHKNRKLPEPSSSKQVKAFRMTSSGSVPLSRSPNMVRNMVKLIGPGASLIMPSRYSSEGFFPERQDSVWHVR